MEHLPGTTDLNQELQPENTFWLSPNDEEESTETGIYYRSRVFTATSGVNALVSSAQPLLSFLARLPHSHELPDRELFMDNLTHELKTFVSRANNFGYPKEKVLLARFIMLAVIDETIQQCTWFSDWTPPSPLTHFYPQQHHGQLYVILDRINHSPEENLELLELAYLSLNLGVSNKQSTNHDFDTTVIIDHLYQSIRNLRGDTSKKLFLTPYSLRRLPTKPKSIWKFATIALVVMGLCYTGFNYLLNTSINILPQTLFAKSTKIKSVNLQNDENI